MRETESDSDIDRDLMSRQKAGTHGPQAPVTKCMSAFLLSQGARHSNHAWEPTVARMSTDKFPSPSIVPMLAADGIYHVKGPAPKALWAAGISPNPYNHRVQT